MNKRFFLITVSIALSITLFACGKQGPTTNIEVNMVEFTFTPSEFTVPAGQEITVKATNNGAVRHDFVIFKLGTDAGEKFGPEDKANAYWQGGLGTRGQTATY